MQYPQEADHKGKPYWANFKCNLYHHSMDKIFESIVNPSWYGMAVHCADDNVCHIFPMIQDISADTEES